MTTISVPIPPAMEESLNELIRNGRGSNKAELVRRAIKQFVENEAMTDILIARQEIADGQIYTGDLRKLIKTIK